MRLGIVIRPPSAAMDARAAESMGAFGVFVAPSDGTWTVAGAAAATATRFARIVVRVPLGEEHPVTLAEDLAVLDDVSGGRVVAVLDTGDLDLEAAREDVGLIRAALTARPLRHRGQRWQVPAGIDGHDAPDAIQITPAPTQVEVPLWVDGAAAAGLTDASVPRLVHDPDEADASRTVQPGVASLTGELDADRQLVNRWADAGVTHLLLVADDLTTVLPDVGRYLIPEVAMPGFPRLIAEAVTPPPWEGPARYVPRPDDAVARVDG